jgi:hypothetical protein
MKENPIPWRVIRAAPDMLAALERIAGANYDTSGDWFGWAQEQARAAIAKAKGEKE